MDLYTGRLVRDAMPVFKVAAGVVLALAICIIMIFGKEVIVHIVLGVLLSFALSPIVNWLERHGIGRGISISFAILFAMSAIVGTVYVGYDQATKFAQEIPSYEPTLRSKIAGLSRELAKGGAFTDAGNALARVLSDVQQIGSEGETAKKASIPSVKIDSGESGIAAALYYAEPLFSPLGTLFVVLLLTAFILAERESLRNKLIYLAGADDLQQTTAAIDDAGRRVSRMLLTQIAVNTVFGLVIGTGLWTIGLPSPFLWGIVAGILRFVPYVGAVIALIIPAFVAFSIDPGWTTLVYTLLLFSVIEPIVGHIIEPMLYGHSAGLSPVAIIVSATVWAYLWGPIGLVLSTPLTICLVVMARYTTRLKFLEVLLGDRPVLAPHEIFYQRMLAGDPHEASVQANAYVSERDKTDYYDNIALEAIRRAHLDIIRGLVKGDRLLTLVKSTNQLVSSLEKQRKTSGRVKTQNPETSAALDLITRHSNTGRFMQSDRRRIDEGWSSEIPVAILYGDNPLDVSVGGMLQQSLADVGLPTQAFEISKLDCTSAEAQHTRAMICLSFIEPLSLVHLRASLRAVRVAMPKAEILLCIWQKTDTAIIASMRKKLLVTHIATTITDAVDIVFRQAQRQISSIPKSPT